MVWNCGKSITVLKLRVTSDTDATLNDIAKLCRIGRNAGLENWLLRQRGMPETDRQSVRLVKNGNGQEDKPKVESTKIYHAIREAVPQLGTTQASMLASAIASNLSAKLDWRANVGENGKRPRRRDAILSYDHRPPFFCGGEIPLHNAHTKVQCDDRLTITIHRPMADLQDLVCELSLREMPDGKRKLLRQLSEGTRKLADSKLVERDGKWYWHVPFTFETCVRSDIEATLWPTIGAEKNGRQTDRPFRLELPGRTWNIGDGRYLVMQTQRLILLRKMIGLRYRKRQGAGHGRQKVDAAVSKRRKGEWDVRNEVRRRAIADVVRQCMQHQCGILIYREPSLPLRERCWFKAMGVDWDWTRFADDLANAAARQGIDVCKQIWKWKDAIPKTEDQPAEEGV